MIPDLDSISRVLALAAGLESEGQYNNAKLVRAAVDSLLTTSAHQRVQPRDRAALLSETDWAIKALSSASVSPELLAALDHSRTALSQGRLPTFVETADPYVCLICGRLALENTTMCPVCGAQPGTFKRFRPIYWIEALDPIESMERLRATPEKVAALLSRAGDDQANQTVEEGGWNLRQAVSHLKDAQGVLDFRVNLILDQDNPVLESKAVFEWASNETGRPATAREIFETYRASRRRTIERLENIPLKDWWRCGRHEEFGELHLYEQVSYFASHGLTHLPQIKALVETSG